MKLVELQIDRLVGPTHHFGGLGVGNNASQASFGQVSHPAAAAIQGLDKMRLVAELGLIQWILAPQPRPDMAFLNGIGFTENDRDTFKRVYQQSPELLSAATSSSAMWTANAATVTPGIDSGQSKTNIMVANLTASIHRAIEPDQTNQELRQLLQRTCQIHRPLPGGVAMRDEGAANHMRLGSGDNVPGINLFVYGDQDPMPKSRWPRQSRAACQAIARMHQLPAENTFYFKQHPGAIDAGAFHNDVVAISHHDLLIHHESAFQVDPSEFDRLSARFEQRFNQPLRRIVVTEQMLSLTDAIATYLFNSQVVSPTPDSIPVLVCTKQVREHSAASALVDHWCQQKIFSEVHYVELDQSMLGGGGPACLRLRVPMPQSVADTYTSTSMAWSEALDGQLREVIQSEYPDSLTISELTRADFCQHAIQTTFKLRQMLSR